MEEKSPRSEKATLVTQARRAGGARNACKAECFGSAACPQRMPSPHELELRTHAAQSHAQLLQRCSCICLPLCRCKAEESHSLRFVLRNTVTVGKHDAQAALSICMPLCRCKAVESHSLRLVLRNTFTLVKHEAQVALS